MTDGEALFRPTRWHSSQRKGFISFMLAAVFLFSLIPAAMLVSSRQPDLSFEDFRATLVGEVAVKQAFYQSSKSAAETACLEARAEEAAAFAAGKPPPAPAEQKIREAILANAAYFENHLRQQGYGISFWCGNSDENSRRSASAAMLAGKSAKPPPAAMPLGFCLQSFQVSLNGSTSAIFLNNLGFSLYDPKLGTAKAAAFPQERGVEFACA